MRLLVIAKEPVPGLVKTRLSPPYTPEQAAQLAAAALGDTLEAVQAVPGTDAVLVLSGRRPQFVDTALPVVAQRGDGLAARLSAAFEDATGDGPVLLVGMDTPQLTPTLLASACAVLASAASGAASPVAVLGPAADGGWWALGLTRSQPRLLEGVPMSVASTAAATRQRLVERGYRVLELPVLRDVDTATDVAEVAAAAPDTRFAALVRHLEPVPMVTR